MPEPLPRVRLISRIRLHREIYHGEITDTVPPLSRRGQGRTAYYFRASRIIIVYDYKGGYWRASTTVIRGPRLNPDGSPCGERFVSLSFPYIRLPFAPQWVRGLVARHRPLAP